MPTGLHLHVLKESKGQAEQTMAAALSNKATHHRKGGDSEGRALHCKVIGSHGHVEEKRVGSTNNVVDGRISDCSLAVDNIQPERRGRYTRFGGTRESVRAAAASDRFDT